MTDKPLDRPGDGRGLDQHGSNLPAEEPIANPGLPAHLPRPTDVDPAAEKRAERQVATFFVISMISAVLFCVAYFALEIGDNPDTFLGKGASTVALGVTLGFALLGIGIGVIQWARKLMSDVEIVEMRHPAASSEEDRATTLAALSAGLEESGIGRRPLVRNSMIGAMGLLGLPAVVALRDLYPEPLSEAVDKLKNTFWESGTRVVNDVTGRPIRPSDLEIGTLVNAEPEGLVHPYAGEREGIEYVEGADLLAEKAKAAVIVVRMEPEEVTEATSNWGVDGIVAYSKICTHVGCPISLWEQQTHHLLCPCHQSTFDLADKGRVIFGPAARALPQLPIEVGPDGYLVAVSDFREPVGPSFWERG